MRSASIPALVNSVSRVYLYSFSHYHRMPMSRIDELTLLSPGFQAGQNCTGRCNYLFRFAHFGNA